ncbi:MULTISPECIES: hypothetical protein [unclassified Polaribacter]|uniref:hypothetical protein n=1 Tax=unclassified Polaribacter TaxID=196858 RepID=UPI0011BE4FE2|nr:MULTISPECIES: hypothetical protein [unclassified Polaribacter]TXD52054.1 hypothetical protein ES043_09415 [Polaribacter sp. IC063]TXD59776.1 hypothetical protein ES044_08905 [Polaribacter sp. IC066]
MKTNIYFLSILILFQSCYSYKIFDLKNYKTIQPDKVKIELENSKKYKGEIIAFNNNRILLKSFEKNIEIPVSDIKTIKERKVSVLKIMGLSFSIALTSLIILLAVLLNGFR